MADMLNTRPLDHSVVEIDYKPISAWAVAALTVSGLYALIIGTIAITALYVRQPALSSAWIFAGVGLFLSIIARAHIKRSEGTRVGLRYATIAWWLSVIGGITFFAYNITSKFALKQQAERAATEWFDLLKQSKNDPVKLNQAFLLTIEPTRRQNIDPGNSSELDANFGGGPLPGFRNSDLIRYFERNGGDVSVESLGVSNLEQIDTGYKLEYSFQLRSPEGVANLNIVMFGSEGKNIVGREWHILMPPGGMSIKASTTYGRLLRHLQDEAREVAVTWVQQFTAKQSIEYYLSTMPADKRAGLAAVLDAIRIAFQKVAGVPAPPLVLTAIPDVVVPPDEAKDRIVFHALQANGFFNIGTVTEDKKNRLREAFRVGMMLNGGESRLVNPDTAPQIRVTGQEIRYTFPVDLSLAGRTGGFCAGRLVIVSQSPQLVAELDDLFGKGKAHPEANDDSQFNLLTQRSPRNWRVIQLETNLEPLAAPKQGPGGGPPGMPGPGGP
jgi:hypothetical protein